MTTMSFKFDDSILKLIFLLHSDSPVLKAKRVRDFLKKPAHCKKKKEMIPGKT